LRTVGIPNKLLKDCAYTLAEPLAMMLSKSYSQARTPGEWKRADITPIYKKKGSRLSALNYRPVSLLTCISKISERIFLASLSEELDELEIKDPTQHGFVPGRSCTTNHLTARNRWTKSIDEGVAVDIFFADVEKAFDTAVHGILVDELYSRGVSLEKVRWIADFLDGRMQRVVVNGEDTDWVPVTSGVPQGSVLGPKLFSLYTSESHKDLHSDCDKFADDVRASNENREDTDSQVLQTDINKFHSWYTDHGMRLHPGKSFIMHLGHNNQRHEYFMDGTRLEATDHTRDCKGSGY
jgi:hypothetical protein